MKQQPDPFRRLPLSRRFIVDGGHLVWLVGSSPHRKRAWTPAFRPLFTRSAGAIILMDSHESRYREEFFPAYKSKRQERRLSSVEWQAKVAMVEEFRDEWVLPDPGLDLISVPGFEADDLIAVMASLKCLPEPLRVIGVDKDLLQIGDWDTFQMKRVTGQRMTLSKFVDRLPMAVQPWIREPWDVLLALCLLGDKSDTIPRLLPPRRFEDYWAIRKSVNPWKKAYTTFGWPFIQNLYLTILPGPFAYTTNPDPTEVYKRLAAGHPAGQLYPLFRKELVEPLMEVLADHPLTRSLT